jgi:PAS domain S-box-containing protein
MVETSDTIFWQIDEEGKILYVNGAVERLGYRREDYIGQTIPPHLHDPAARDAFVRGIHVLCQLAPRPFHDTVRRGHCKDGTPVTFIVSGTPLFDKTGKFTGYCGESRIVTDTPATTRSYIEDSDFFNYLLFKPIIDSLPIRLYWKDRANRFLGGNRLFLEDLGLEHEKGIIGRRDEELFKPEFREISNTGDFEILHLGWEFFTKEIRFVTANGRRIEALLYKTPLKNGHGEVGGVVGVYLDITKEKLRERYLLETLERLREAQNMAKMGYWDYDLVEKKIELSDGMLKILDLPKGTPLGLQEMLDFVHEEDRPAIQKAIGRLLEDPEERLETTFRIRRHHGREKVLQVRAKMVTRDECAETLRGIAVDITETVRLQQDNERKQYLLQQQSRLAQMGQLLDNIAHQWKQPLAEINALLLELDGEFSDGVLTYEAFQRYFDELEQITTFMAETIDNFRSYVLPSDQIATVSPGLMVEETLKLLHHRIEQLGVTLDCHVLPEVTTLGNPQDFIHIFLVILNNALDALERSDVDQPTITIHFEVEGEWLTIRLSDNAGGIDPAIAEHIFDPYFTTKFQSKGRGIGLFMAKAIVENRLQGRLELAKLRPATFRIMLRRLA